MKWPASRPGHLTPKKRPWYLLNSRLLEAKNQSGSFTNKGNPLLCRKSAFTPWPDHYTNNAFLTTYITSSARGTRRRRINSISLSFHE
jgi:hypothetical protein